jgi:cephalosporin hydroxylase
MGLRRFIPPSIRSRFGIPLNSWREELAFRQPEEVYSRIADLYDYNGDLLRIFAENKGKIVHKWHHYIPLYDKYFSRYRGTKVRMLEIGVAKGGSLSMWRKYFGQDAILFGIDIDPACATFNGEDGQVRIGSQDDDQFLRAVVEEMGGVDIVLDDGSHMMRHIKSSLECLFPLLQDGGIYFVEDLHTCYWRDWGGGYGSKASFFRVVSELVDDMHHWYHDSEIKHVGIGSAVSGIHVHDSIVVLGKSAMHPPVHTQVG